MQKKNLKFSKDAISDDLGFLLDHTPKVTSTSSRLVYVGRPWQKGKQFHSGKDSEPILDTKNLNFFKHTLIGICTLSVIYRFISVYHRNNLV